MLRRPPTTLTLTAEDIAAYEDRRYVQLQAQLQTQAQAQAKAQAQAQSQAQAQLQSRSQATRTQLRQHGLPQLSTMDTSMSSPDGSIDEAMEDAASADLDDDDENEEDEEDDDEDDDDDDDDPFTTQRHLQRAALGSARAISPGAQRSAYVQQMRARGGRHARSQSHTQTHSYTHAHAQTQTQAHSHATSIPTSTSAYTSAAATRAQRITGSVSASALPPAAPLGQSSQPASHLQQTPVQSTAQGGTTAMARGGRGGRQASEPPPAPARVTRSRDERIGIAPGARWHSDLAAHEVEDSAYTGPRIRSRSQTPEAALPTVRRIRLRTRGETGTSLTVQLQESPRDDLMQLDGQSEEEHSSEAYEDVYTADLQAEEVPVPAEANVEAGSPIPARQRRQRRSQTMHLAGRAAPTAHPMHARGSSDTTNISTMGGRGPRVGMSDSFASINTPPTTRNGHNRYTIGAAAPEEEEEEEGEEGEDDDYDDDDDRMRID
ncbi:hypothetical protein SAMD00023353_1001520 [Rosellinia necatrix]|uniref:Anaphase-promoting complex, subunit CDC26 n=1 Tax=Rosellinia necatrix TaxID=77044 RepID=A0A1W2TBT1_ROSNE|nr:hypothetical protein SAMD00023353_1001520 [Rosellinia necatrix]